jgi:fibronectin type 3 domain-containing protein
VDASGKDKGVTLDWDEPNTGGAAIEKYNIYRKNETGMWLLIGTVDGTVTKYTDTGLENGVEYFYYVTAVNPAGEGSASETASATANPTMDMMIIIVVIVILAAVGVAAFFLLKRRG